MGNKPFGERINEVKLTVKACSVLEINKKLEYIRCVFHKTTSEKVLSIIPMYLVIKSFDGLLSKHAIAKGDVFLVTGKFDYYKNPRTQKELWSVIAVKIEFGTQIND